MDTIRSTLAPLIREAGVTATAKRMSVSDAALHRWMSGRSSLSRKKIDALARRFGFRVVWPEPRLVAIGGVADLRRAGKGTP